MLEFVPYKAVQWLKVIYLRLEGKNIQQATTKKKAVFLSNLRDHCFIPMIVII
jgi:hypothetical protein